MVSLISLAVMIAGALVVGGPYWLDPVIALILSTVIGCAGIRLAIQAIAAPRGADIDFDNHFDNDWEYAARALCRPLPLNELEGSPTSGKSENAAITAAIVCPIAVTASNRLACETSTIHRSSAAPSHERERQRRERDCGGDQQRRGKGQCRSDSAHEHRADSGASVEADVPNCTCRAVLLP